jgi:16S rRNA processing protein RimM
MKNIIDKKFCTEIGFIKKSHGIKGELLIVYNEGIDEIIEELEFLFFEFNGLLVPFFIHSIYSVGSTSAVLLFDQLDSKEKVKEFVGCKLYIAQDLLQKKNFSIPLKLTEGFTVYDRLIGKIGKITVIENFGGNLVLNVDYNGKEIMIPYNEKILYQFDPDNQMLTLDCPEGLIDLND